MNVAELIREIVSTYKKYGWQLRRILLDEETNKKLSGSLSADAPIHISEINALWFSRLSKNGEAWELRVISQQPFALFENFDLHISESKRETILRETENQLREKIKKRN